MEETNILSIKIVSVDHYNSFPIKNLDTEHSEFRKCAVKQVPVIRIFGITQNKKKICANVHGVFPYFYVPCMLTDHDKINKQMEDLAIALDKSLNVSFGQSNSISQHIFRISLVKGIPYYGYHRGEHQFYRIQLYNPNLIRRTSAVLQSGSILGKQFQPHESHIPFILKFFIDYNLFGMSYLHIPLQFVHVRNADDKTKFRKRSVSQLEVDFKAIFILNRLAAAEDDSTKAANPGIESLWEDERLRRSAMDLETVPPLVSMASQKNICPPTESDNFFRTILRDKLAEKTNESLSATMMDSTSIEGESSEEIKVIKKFNLKNLLDRSAYAAELSQNSSATKSSQEDVDGSAASQTVSDLENAFLNMSEISEGVDEAMDVDEAGRLLKTCSDDGWDDDCVLAPLSQAPGRDLNQSVHQTDEIEAFVDSDDENFNELNFTIADMEMFSQYVEDEVSIPQLDGIDDELENLSPGEITKQNDQKKNLIPQPGPSHLFISPIRVPVKPEVPSPSINIIDSQEVQNNLRKLASHFAKTPEIVKVKTSPSLDSECGEDEDDELITSFYNQTMMIDDFESSGESEKGNQSSDDVKVPVIHDEHSNKRFKANDVGICVIAPAVNPPDPLEVMEKFKDFGIPNRVNPVPFYSNPKDVTKKQEVGHNVLEIPGTRLSDLEDFKSCLLGKSSKPSKKCTEESTAICLHRDPPSYQNAVDWLTQNATEITTQPEEGESPVKDKRERTLMVLEIDEEEISDDLDQTLVPSNPTTPDVIPSSQERDTTPLSQFAEEGLHLSYSARKKMKKMKKSFSRRFQEILMSKAGHETESSSHSEKFSEESLHKTSQSSESAKSFNGDSSIIVKNANVQEDSSFNSSDLTGPSLNNTYGFKMKLESLQANDEHTDLTILAMELHVQTRKDLKPNPEFDEVSAIFYSLDGFYVGNEVKNINGIIACNHDKSLRYVKPGVEVIFVKSEMEAFEVFFRKIREFDPDILAGYEIETASWGYFIQRGYAMNLNLYNALSRMPSDKEEKMTAPVVDEEDQRDTGDYYSEQKIPGRILLDVWRLMKQEIALTSYSFENISYHVLHRRYPKHSFSFLTSHWTNSLRSWIVFDYYVERARTLIEILKQLDLIGRTCELAKLFGIQFYEVLSRGSQFRVESMMIRIAKRRNYVPVSPSVQQRAHARAPEYIPLILEPESRFYGDPVIVLDFQSLYPSIIIAYNYCFSTCLGRVEHLMKASSQAFEFGAYQLRISPARLQHLLDNDLITVSPCGVAFVKEEVKEGVLPRMLREILDTRLMIKASMKVHKNNSALQRLLHSRQLGLKLIANVTYGYTSANFSGRMPAIEVGDSVVSKGRETLEKAIKMVEANKEWGVRVCYGDTDSMFVLVPGRSKEEALEIGEKIAEAVTNENPHPVKLKLEKVYQPCILQTKKRYVGYMYETKDQKEPIYEAKGIETVRRDGCPAAAKILEKTLRILFETCDVSKVKEYVCKQFTKILAGRCSIQDLTFAKEFRGINGYKDRATVPSLTLTRKWMLSDPRNEPRRGERVPFVIVNGAPGLTLIRLVRSPHEVLQDENYKINSIYYITKAIIPPLNRCLLLIGANVFDWFAELPRRQQFLPLMTTSLSSRKGTISQFFTTTNCATCDNQCHQKICATCREGTQKTALILTDKILKLERKRAALKSICESCCRRSFETDCISLDCPVLYTLVKVKRDYKQVDFYREVLEEI